MIDRWEVSACPTATYALIRSAAGILFAWENKGEVFFGDAAGRMPRRTPGAPAAEEKRKFPVLAVNGRGETLLVWTEGAPYRKGGDLAWQVFDRNGKPAGKQGLAKDLVRPAGIPAAYAEPSGRFVILY